MESQVREMLPGAEFTVRQGDLFSITKAERDALLDAMVDGGAYPFVFLDGAVVSSSDLSAEALAAALRGAGE